MRDRRSQLKGSRVSPCPKGLSGRGGSIKDSAQLERGAGVGARHRTSTGKASGQSSEVGRELRSCEGLRRWAGRQQGLLRLRRKWEVVLPLWVPLQCCLCSCSNPSF